MPKQTAHPQPTTDDRILTLSEAAELARYSHVHLRRAVAAGQIATIRFGGSGRGHIRLRASELARWLASNEIPARANAQ